MTKISLVHISRYTGCSMIFSKLGLICLYLLVNVFLFSEIAFANAVGADEECQKLSPTSSNRIETSISEIAIDQSSSTTSDLADMAGLYNESDRVIGGLTSAVPLVEYEVVPNYLILPNQKGICARPALILTVGYSAMKVSMDREIQRESCIYNAIFAHEMHHVSIYKNYIKSHIVQMKQHVDAKFNGSAYYFNSVNEAKQYMEILGQVFIQKLRDRFLSEVEVEQTALDTQAEYSRMQLSCPHWH
jgi:hypothetical protein